MGQSSALHDVEYVLPPKRPDVMHRIELCERLQSFLAQIRQHRVFRAKLCLDFNVNRRVYCLIASDSDPKIHIGSHYSQGSASLDYLPCLKSHSSLRLNNCAYLSAGLTLGSCRTTEACRVQRNVPKLEPTDRLLNEFASSVHAAALFRDVERQVGSKTTT